MQRVIWIVGLFALLQTVSEARIMTDIVRMNSVAEENAWDSLIFTVHWPITACLIWKEGGNHSCTFPDDRQAWTVHGIWPSRTDGGSLGPQFCNNTWKFDPDRVEDLRTLLLRVWPNLRSGYTDDSLWRHEWEKHGTCAALDPQLSSEELYFNKGIQWVMSYPMTKILTKNGIVPSAAYNVSDIFRAVKETVGATPILGCETDRNSGHTYLSEIRLCFKRGQGFPMTDCTRQHKLTSVGDCPTHKLITYPGDASITTRPQRKHKVHHGKISRNKLNKAVTAVFA